MTNNIAKIRAALEWGEDSVFIEALAALAELERAAQTPAPVAEIHEPTPAEESRMCEIYDARIKETAHGRAMFSAVAAYLRGELK